MEFVDKQQPGIWTSVKNSMLNFIFVKRGEEGFRTFHGVFLPSILSIVGVILYLRLGWIVGEMGFALTTSIICFATTITLITAFSISACSTNMHVGNGGAYFIISRSFGAVIGSAIGLSLFCAQSIGIAFYIMGFSETFNYIFPSINSDIIEFSTLALLGIISLLSTNLVMRTQFLIFLFVILSLCSFFLGMEITDFKITENPVIPSTGYWAAFALFFPAVTGLEAGIAMSGELKNPRRSLPLGTITAVVMGLLLYLSIAYILWKRVPQQLLVTDSMIMETIAWSGPLIILGIFGATLSSALGSIMAAPRTLQAMSQDGIVPKFLSKEFGKNQEPRLASMMTLLIVAFCLYMGDLNYIAPVLTMFFLISYGMLNLAAGLEGLINNPSWRPTVCIPSSISLFGAFLCLVTMLLIDASYTLLSGFLIIPVYMIIKRRSKIKFDDIRQSVILFFLKKAIYRLLDTKHSPRTWRPNVLAFTRNLNPSPLLLDFTSSITGGNGFLTIAHCHDGEHGPLNIDNMKSLIKQSLLNKKIPSLVEVFLAPDTVNGFKNMILGYGLGQVRPNTIVMKIEKCRMNNAMTVQIAAATLESNKNLILLAENEKISSDLGENSQIDIWWDSELNENNNLMMVISQIYSHSGIQKNLRINVKGIVENEIEKHQLSSHFDDLFKKNHLSITAEIYVANKDGDKDLIMHFFSENSIAFFGIRPIKKDEKLEAFQEYLEEMISKTARYHFVGLFLANEKIELEKIIFTQK